MSFDQICDWLTERYQRHCLPYGLESVGFRLTPDDTLGIAAVARRGDQVVWARVEQPEWPDSDDPIRWLVPATRAVFSLHHYLEATP